MSSVLTWIVLAGPVSASTLPTECPVIVTGEEVAPFRAEVVAPAVLSVSGRLYRLQDREGDPACPAVDGATCTASTGVQFSGTLTKARSSDAEECWNGASDGTTREEARAGLLTAAPLDGASLSADGTASDRRTTAACTEYSEEEGRWFGTLAVEGPWEALDDDAIVGEARSFRGRWTAGYGDETYAWNGTSGACTWSAESSVVDYGGPADHEIIGRVEVAGVVVSYAWSVSYLCVADCGWTPVQSSTWVDGVRAGDANWAGDDVHEVAPWVDADDDGWAPPADCDDTDLAVQPSDGKWDCDGDGYLGGTPDPDAQDCDDADPTIHPDARDVECDGVNQDCGYHDEDCDGDGHGSRSGDCDDTDAAVHPGAEDRAIDGVDADCDGIDGVDHDGDGYDAAVDCDDSRAARHPGATETCGDDIDQDCDGRDGCEDDEPAPAPTPPAKGCSTATPSGGAPLVVLVSLALAGRRRNRRPGGR